MQAGQIPHNPLTQLNSHMQYGAMAGLTDMGLNLNDTNMVRQAGAVNDHLADCYPTAPNDGELTTAPPADVRRHNPPSHP